MRRRQISPWSSLSTGQTRTPGDLRRMSYRSRRVNKASRAVRPKPTFSARARSRGRPRWAAEYAQPEDADLSPELAELLWRARWHYDPADQPPPRRDLRKTLEALSKLSGSAQQAALARLDPWTEARLATAALQLWRLAHPAPADVPPGLFKTRSWSDLDVHTYAQRARRRLPPSSGGRPSTRWADEWLMGA